ncbi:MAG: hypothetical protein AB7U34_04805 [Novosphingobium sp.]
MTHFRHFAAIDWSGAAGERHKGIAIAICDGAEQGAQHAPAPRLVRRDRDWSRTEALQFLQDELPDDTLVGLDLGMALPFMDAGAFFPDWPESPPDARSLWALVDDICADDADLGVGSVVDHPELCRYFRRHGGREGGQFHLPGATHRRGRFRLTEEAQARMGCKPYSNFNLVGAAQVGKASLSGMRMLHRLAGTLPVWPVDPLPDTGSVVVEIYTALAAIAGGRRAGASKIRTSAELNQALACLGSDSIVHDGAIDDHSADAIVTAAWLRKVANNPQFWSPKALTSKIGRTEGWTFGAV